MVRIDHAGIKVVQFQDSLASAVCEWSGWAEPPQRLTPQRLRAPDEIENRSHPTRIEWGGVA
jgi:hypothetical protein